MLKLPASWESLNVDQYLSDFAEKWATPGLAGFVKLERRQTFVEPGNPSWEAFVGGNWAEAERLAAESAQGIEPSPFPVRRVRIVEEPLSDYLRWELMVLRYRASAGEDIRVLDATAVRDEESAAQLPELTVLAEIAAYEVRYDAGGALTGAGANYERAACQALYDQLLALCDRATPLLNSTIN